MKKYNRQDDPRITSVLMCRPQMTQNVTSSTFMPKASTTKYKLHLLKLSCFFKSNFWPSHQHYLGMWPWTSPTYAHSHIASMTKVWWQLVFNWSYRSNLGSMTLKYDLEPHQHISTPILHLWLKFGGNWCSTVPADAMWGHMTFKCDIEPHKHTGTPILHLWLKFGGQLAFNCSCTIWGQWPSNVTLNLTSIWAILYCIHDSSLVTIGVQLFLQEHFGVNALEMWPWTSPTYGYSHIEPKPKFEGSWCPTVPAGAILGQWLWNVTLNLTNIQALPYIASMTQVW